MQLVFRGDEDADEDDDTRCFRMFLTCAQRAVVPKWLNIFILKW